MKKKTTWLFVFQKYGKFWSVLLGHFIKHTFVCLCKHTKVKLIISEEESSVSILFHFSHLFRLIWASGIAKLNITTPVSHFNSNFKKNICTKSDHKISKLLKIKKVLGGNINFFAFIPLSSEGSAVTPSYEKWISVSQ